MSSSVGRASSRHAAGCQPAPSSAIARWRRGCRVMRTTSRGRARRPASRLPDAFRPARSAAWRHPPCGGLPTGEPGPSRRSRDLGREGSSAVRECKGPSPRRLVQRTGPAARHVRRPGAPRTRRRRRRRGARRPVGSPRSARVRARAGRPSSPGSARPGCAGHGRRP